MFKARLQGGTSIDVASTANIKIGDGNSATVTGTTDIHTLYKLNWQSGAWVLLYFSGTVLLKHQGSTATGYARFLLAGEVDAQMYPGNSIVLWYNGTDWKEFTRSAIVNANQLVWTKTASTTVANTTAETTLLDTGVGSKTLTASFFRVGRTLFFEVVGYYSNTVTPTIQFKFKLGSVVVLDTGAITTPVGVTNQQFRFKGQMTCRTTGATGTIFAQGEVEIGGLAIPILPVVNTAATTIDTTGTLVSDVMVTWGTASTSNTITATNAQEDGKG